MLRKSQIVILSALGVVLWLGVALNIRFRPQTFLDPVRGTLRFVVAPLAGWISVWLCKLVAKLSPDQLLPGVAVAGAAAMMMDGAALRWFSTLYGFDERTLRIGAAWLLWGYGVAFAVAVIWAARLQRRIA
jgi:hypothetical protein